MNKLIVPDLYCPFPSKTNKHVDVLEKHALEWVLQFKLLPNNSAYQELSDAKSFLLTASAYPYCKFQYLEIANDFMNWIIIWDEVSGLLDKGQQVETIKTLHKRFIEILQGSELIDTDIPLSFALSDLRQRMLEVTSVKWFSYFVRSFDEYIDGCVQESINWVQEIVPDIETYTTLRQATGVMEPLMDLIEFCDNLMLPDFLRENDIIQKLRMMTNKIICLCNDIFSVAKEMAVGDFHNFIFVLHYQQQISLEEAIKCVADMHDREVKAMIDLEASIPSFGEELDVEIAKYISGLHTWIRGHLDWYSHSGRYQNVTRLESVKY
ncbi:terpene synthase [Nostocaceae cyanobacterium CENA369]|uniref:Terpene synthase n=1 Tax=Dendronalium phyllosphericum CENA369 TaxID=1725256 RepID=A0A8J7LH97_9NOST|nr:terpene synthase [Dendronalium phyllosphericum]MBH8575968.1 terpene synthase [Dendronalium phyllosphericum CENA369]